jgi:hypothetical protein
MSVAGRAVIGANGRSRTAEEKRPDESVLLLKQIMLSPVTSTVRARNSGHGRFRIAFNLNIRRRCATQKGRKEDECVLFARAVGTSLPRCFAATE